MCVWIKEFVTKLLDNKVSNIFPSQKNNFSLSLSKERQIEDNLMATIAKLTFTMEVRSQKVSLLWQQRAHTSELSKLTVDGV